MSDRRLATYTEERLPTGPHWTMEIERSASGRPDIFITLRSKWFDGTHEDEKTVVVTDADEVFAPVMEWLAARREEVSA